jgi:hypothetical protein
VTIEGMNGDLGTGRGGERGVVADVIPVAMGRDDEFERPVARGQLIGDPGEGRRRGIDGDRLARPLVGQHVDIGRDRADDPMDPLHAV